MIKPTQSLWHTLARLNPVDGADAEQAAQLFAEYQSRGSLRHTCKEMLELPDRVIIDFYRRLAEVRSTQSPVANRANSGWMADADFCFINIRATGQGNTPGTPIQAAKLLPILRVNAIHLGPFTLYDFQTIYAVQSLRSIALQITDTHLAGLEFSAEQQLKALVEAAHLTGMAVGFDLEPHTAQFSITAVQQPECFRWIKLAENPDQLAGGMAIETMLQPDIQTQIAHEISQRTRRTLHLTGLDTLEFAFNDPLNLRQKKLQTFQHLVMELIEAGYWTIPAQVWSADGLPAYAGFNHQGHYPRFTYLSRAGEDHSNYAYHIATPFRFYHGLKINQPPDTDQPPQPDPAGQELYTSAFSYWRDEFGFDFVRYDSVDHIFDSIHQDNWELPASDRPTPAVLAECIRSSKTPDFPYIGNLAERMGNEIEPYAQVGFDLMLGDDMLSRIDRGLMEKSFRLQEQLSTLNQQRPVRFAVTFCVDTHDTGNPYLWGQPLIQRMGCARMRLRHFVSRFISSGKARRPKYEVIGAQDLSYGLFQANISDANLNWVGDAAYLNSYHFLEDIYDRFRDILASAEKVRSFVSDTTAWWVFRHQNRLLVSVIALEQGEAEGYPQMLTLGLRGLLPNDPPLQVHFIDFNAQAETHYTTQQAEVEVYLPPLSFFLMEITPAQPG